MAKYENILYEKKGAIAYLTLNRPEKLNAMDEATRIEIGQACFEANDDEDVNVIVVRGEGRCFSSGWDIAPGSTQPKFHFPEMRKGREWETWDMLLNRQSPGEDHIFWKALWDNMKPSIAQIHGYCLAGGCLLMSLCDLAIASEDALFGYPAARLLAEQGGTPRRAGFRGRIVGGHHQQDAPDGVLLLQADDKYLLRTDGHGIEYEIKGQPGGHFRDLDASRFNKVV